MVEYGLRKSVRMGHGHNCSAERAPRHFPKSRKSRFTVMTICELFIVSCDSRDGNSRFQLDRLRSAQPGEFVITAGARDGFSAMQAFQAMPLPSSSALRGHDRMGATPIRDHGDQRTVRATEPILSLSAGAER
jgi:hypothetical protein